MSVKNLLSRGRVPAALSVWAVCVAALAQQPAPQLSPDQAAQVVLDGARRAYGEGKFDVAAARYREFLKSYAGHKEAASAQYGLARALLGIRAFSTSSRVSPTANSHRAGTGRSVCGLMR